jgi:DNA-damage-inducible protein D
MTKKKENQTAELLPQQGECVVSKFLGKEQRKTFHNNEWWFVLADVIIALTETTNVESYIKSMKNRDPELAKGWLQFVTPLEFNTAGGPQKINCSNMEGIFRIVQSISSKNAEPFKKWLAKTGFERLQEIENPELAHKRAVMYYKLQGRDDHWIRNRLDGISTREELTNEWKNRDIKPGQEYATLTNIISQETFGVSVSKHKEIKTLKKENLRDHMSTMELIFQRLGEQATIDETKRHNSQGFEANKKSARDGGSSAGAARKAYEEKSGIKIVTAENFINNLPKNAELKEVNNFEPILTKIANTKKPE